METKVEGNPWLEIWVRPKETIRKIITVDPKYKYWILCVLYGLPMGLNMAQSSSLAAHVPMWAVVIGALIVSGLLGWIGITVTTALLFWTGKWIGGTGRFDTVRTAVAWSNVPNIITTITWVALIAVFGTQLFCKDFAETPFFGYEAGTVFLVFLLQSIASIWGFIMLLNGLSEVQGFSLWRAVLNVIIPFLIVVAAIWLVGWVMWGTAHIAN